MNKNSPQRVIELCIYIVLIIGIMIWVVVTGETLNPFDIVTTKIGVAIQN